MFKGEVGFELGLEFVISGEEFEFEVGRGGGGKVLVGALGDLVRVGRGFCFVAVSFEELLYFEFSRGFAGGTVGVFLLFGEKGVGGRWRVMGGGKGERDRETVVQIQTHLIHKQ